MTHRVVRVLVAALLAALVGGGLPALTWNIEKVTTAPEDDGWPFVAVDHNNRLHIGYDHFDGDMEIFYATNAAGPWQTSRVTDNSYDDWMNDILVAPDGVVHIAIQGWDGTDYEIYHAYGTPGSWTIERVTDNTIGDFAPSMGRSSDGALHIAYNGIDPSGTDNEIFYANNRAGPWVREQVTFNTVDDGYASLALDRLGNPRVAFWRGIFPNLSVRYARKQAGIWDDVGVAPPQTWLPALALDRNEFAHVAYSKYDGADWEIYYANDVTGTWQESQVTANSVTDAYNSIEIDNSGYAHIVYLTDDGDAELFYATDAAGVWQTSRVTDNAVADAYYGNHQFMSDRNGFGHIFFHNGASGNADVYHAMSDVPIHSGVAEPPRPPRRSALALATRPEPCTDAAVVSYALPGPAAVALDVFDAAGRRVTTLAAGTMAAGAHQVVWNTQTVRPGVYFCRLAASGSVAVHKVTVIH